MALTATQLTRLRDLTGGRTNTRDRDHLTDTELQAEYTETGDDWNLTIVGVLRRRIGMAAAYVDKSHDINSISLSQRVKHMRDLLKDAEEVAGVTGSILSVGVIDYNIDTDADDVSAS